MTRHLRDFLEHLFDYAGLFLLQLLFQKLIRADLACTLKKLYGACCSQRK